MGVGRVSCCSSSGEIRVASEIHDTLNPNILCTFTEAKDVN